MGNFISYKKVAIRYTDSGQGKPIVLLHGFLESISMWKNLTPVLRKKFRVVAIDLPGHGASGCLGYIHTMSEMADVVKAVIAELKLDDIIMIGHSMGGYVALAYAEKYGMDLIGLCLANSTASADDEYRILNRDRAIAAVNQNHKTFVRLAIPGLFRPKNRRLFSKEIQQLKEEALLMTIQGIVAALAGMKERPGREHILRAAPFKTLMIVGKKDPVLSYELMIDQAKTLDMEFIELEDGHMSYIENMKDFTYFILQFIEKL